MYHDLIIHPSRAELTERVFSPESSQFRENRLSSKDLNFKIDFSVIENGRHYETLKNALAELLSPHRNALSVLNVVVPVSFAQTKIIHCGPEYPELDDYINWEASKMITEVKDHYRYGTFYDSFTGSLVIAVIRKNVSDFFTSLLKEVFPAGIEFRIGYRYEPGGERKEFIQTEKRIHDQVHYESVMEDQPIVKKKSVFISVSFLALMAVLSAYYYFNPDQYRKISEYWNRYVMDKIPYKITIERKPELPAAPAEVVQPAGDTKIATVDSLVSDPADGKDVKETVQADKIIEKPTPVKQAPVKTPGFWKFVEELSRLDADSVVFENGESISIFSGNEKTLSSAASLDPEKIYGYTSEGEKASFSHKSFNFENSWRTSNYNNLLKVKSGFDIKPVKYRPNVYRFEQEDKFYEFLNAVNENSVEFRKFSISRDNDQIIFTWYVG